MLKFILVRHGETESNKRGAYVGWTDVGLNEIGIKQANIVKEKLKNEEVSQIYCSPLKRAVKTAEIISENYGKEIIIEDGLKEINFGLWDNLVYNEIREKYPLRHREWLKGGHNFVFPEGESAKEAFERHKNFIHKLTSELDEGTILLITHGGFIRNAIAFLLGMEPEDAWHFSVDNGSITKIENSKGYGVLCMLNG